MSTATVVHERKTLNRVVEIVFEEGEMPATSGDRKRGSNDRREARIESLRIAYYWSFTDNRWKIEAMMRASVAQKLASGEFGEAKTRNIWGSGDGSLEALRNQYLPQSTIELVES